MSANSIWVSTDLVLDNTKYGEDERVLIMTGDSVDLIEAIADVAEHVDVYDNQFSTLKRLRHYVRKDNVSFFDEVYPTVDGVYDSAVVFVPKGRDYGRALMWSAMTAVKQGGDLYIVGPNKGGAKSLIKDATQAFGDCQVLGYKKSHRVAVTKKEEAHYTYPADWGAIPTKPTFFTAETAMGTVDIATQAGIFSEGELDEGTAFLLENLVMRDAETVLDIGCGSGVIGAVLSAHADHITMIDNDLLAINCAKATVAKNELKNVTVMGSNLYTELDSEQKFDLIISNPPFHRGFEVSTNVTRKLIAQAPNYLNAGGRLVIVANEFLKYEDDMEEVFKSVDVRAKNNKFKVLEGIL